MFRVLVRGTAKFFPLQFHDPVTARTGRARKKQKSVRALMSEEKTTQMETFYNFTYKTLLF